MFRISLNTMTLQIQSDRVYTQLGVAITVTGIAQVNITEYLLLKIRESKWLIINLFGWLLFEPH